MRDLEALAGRVHAAGGKMTAQRTLIYRALDSDTTHPTAEELYARLRDSLPHLSLTTVYKALNELVEWGEVRRLDAGDGRMRFDPDTRDHAEAVCLRCHRVTDVPNPISTAASPAEPSGFVLPAELAGYAIVRRAEIFFGYCPRCRDDRTAASPSSPARDPELSSPAHDLS